MPCTHPGLSGQRGLSQVMLAGRAGVSLTTVSKLDLLTEQDREFPQFSG